MTLIIVCNNYLQKFPSTGLKIPRVVSFEQCQGQYHRELKELTTRKMGYLIYEYR
jgi:hypothetical protein